MLRVVFEINKNSSEENACLCSFFIFTDVIVCNKWLIDKLI